MNLLDRTESKTDWLPIIFLTLLASCLRWPGIDLFISDDEANSFLMFGGIPWQELIFSYQEPNQHTFFSILSNLFQQVLGENELVFRLPALLAGVLAVPLAYILSFKFSSVRTIAFLSALFLAVSTPHIRWSQVGRGYTLSIFLSILVLISVFRLLEKEKSMKWGSVLVISGFCMVLTLPSNVYLVLGASLFFVFMALRQSGNKSGASVNELLIRLIPLAVLFGLVLIYFLSIYEDLQKGMESYKKYAMIYEGAESVRLSLERFWLIARELVSPLGPGFFLFVVCGVWFLKGESKSCVLLIFSIPILGAWIMGVLGPPRAFLFWLPFVMILAACGMVGIIDQVGGLTSSQVRNVFTTALVIFLMVPSFLHLKKYYPQKFDKQRARQTSLMAEAREALTFIENETLDHELVVFPYHDRVLRRYIEKPVAQKMLNIFREGKLDKITFLGHQNMTPEKIPDVGIKNASVLSEKILKKTGRVGDLSIYSFDYEILRIYPGEKNMDHESEVPWLKSPGVTLSMTDEHKIMGRTSMVARKEFPGKISIMSEQTKYIKLEKGGGHFLFIYAKQAGQESYGGLGISPIAPEPVYLNYVFGVFEESGSEYSWYRVSPHYTFIVTPDEFKPKGKHFYWQLVFYIVPLGEGTHYFEEAVLLRNKVSYFDGFQIFSLRK